MFSFLARHLHKTIHLVHTKPPPPPPITLNTRNMPVLFRSPEVLPASPFSVSFTSPVPTSQLVSVENTRFPVKSVKPESKTVKATRKYLRTSIKKLWPIIRTLKHLHVEDAISGLEAMRKKPAEWVKNIVKAGIRNAVNIKGMSEDRLYVQHFILGKNRGIKGIRYHAKGRTGSMMRPKSQVTVVIAEKTVEDFYETIMDGKFSPAIAAFLRAMLLENNANYEEITQYQHYLTAKGRQQQKLMFKRKVHLFVEEKLKSGVILSKEHAKELILQEESKKFAENYWAYKKVEIEKKLAERQEIFTRNQKSR